MNLVGGSPAWLIAILILALVAAAVEDVVRLRISNLSCAIVFIGAILAMGLQGVPMALWQNVLVCCGILVIGTFAFSAGWLGGGDVKLLAAVGLWLDPRAAVGLIGAVFVAGGLVAAAYIAARRIRRPGRSTNIRSGKVPYGVAIVVGALFVFGTQLNQHSANPFIDKMRAEAAAGH
jgi:prepilin peptidase CpaA